MKTVRHLYDVSRGCRNDVCIGLTPITGNKSYFRMRYDPLPYLVAIAGVEDGKCVPGVVVNNCTRIYMSLLLGKIVYPDIPACMYLWIAHSYTANYTMTCRCTCPDMLIGQCPYCRGGRLVE